MLMRLLRSHLQPYRKQIVLVTFLQLVQTVAALYLPRLNASIVDNGIARKDHPYIWRTGALMLVVTVAVLKLKALALILPVPERVHVGTLAGAAVTPTLGVQTPEEPPAERSRVSPLPVSMPKLVMLVVGSAD